MPELYVPVTDEDGNTSYVLLSEADIDVSEVEIPDTIVEASERFKVIDNAHKNAVKESKKRLRRAQQAEQALSASDNDDDESEDDESDDSPPTPVQPMSEDEMFEKFYSRLSERQQAQAQEVQAKQSKLKGLIDKHKLQEYPDAMHILETSTDPDTVAAVLGRHQLRFEDSTGGETPADMTKDDMAGVYEKIGVPPPTTT